MASRYGLLVAATWLAEETTYWLLKVPPLLYGLLKGSTLLLEEGDTRKGLLLMEGLPMEAIE